ncbi:acetyl-CoA carboxylase biotin carboxyl carrier protein [Paenibacillus thermotolerans]|uniref:acetyl-CoA carboxylase biotin carboxyl carrier protein n=1 Tax=Paenibacillus thermotolerans TaxID=3027807 RepID=UPI0023685945|nr:MULTISPECIES: acetyl-CoA carboxylase biotin carboxyl carrier protein [unclassified Paenibacillus]
MYKISEIKELMKIVDSTTIQEVHIENENGKLTIRKQEPKAAEAPVVIHHAAAAAAQPVYAAAPAPAAAAAPAVPAAAPEAQPAAGEAPAADANLHRIVSPMVGTFYAASAPGAAPFVKVGDSVSEKTVVCIVEAMKLMNEIEAEVNGTIVEILAENGQLVEYGQPLFLVKR